MDTEQEGDSLSTTVGKEGAEATALLSPRSINDDAISEKSFALEETNEESEISVISGASAAVSQGSGKKKRKRRRNKKRNTNDDGDIKQQPQISRAGSNEALNITEEKPVILTTYVCSSSELDKARKLATEKSNIPAQAEQTEPDELEDTPAETKHREFGSLKRDEIPRVVFLKDNTDDEASSAYENSRQEASYYDDRMNALQDIYGTLEPKTTAEPVEPADPTSESLHVSSEAGNGSPAAVEQKQQEAESPEKSVTSEASTVQSVDSQASKKSKNAKRKERRKRKKSLLASKAQARCTETKQEETSKTTDVTEDEVEDIEDVSVRSSPRKEDTEVPVEHAIESPDPGFDQTISSEETKVDGPQSVQNDSISVKSSSSKQSVRSKASAEHISLKEANSAASAKSSKCSLADENATQPATYPNDYLADEELVVNMLSDTAIAKSIEEIVAEKELEPLEEQSEKSEQTEKSRSSKGSSKASKKSKSSKKSKASVNEGSGISCKDSVAESLKSVSSRKSQQDAPKTEPAVTDEPVSAETPEPTLEVDETSEKSEVSRKSKISNSSRASRKSKSSKESETSDHGHATDASCQESIAESVNNSQHSLKSETSIKALAFSKLNDIEALQHIQEGEAENTQVSPTPEVPEIDTESNHTEKVPTPGKTDEDLPASEVGEGEKVNDSTITTTDTKLNTDEPPNLECGLSVAAEDSQDTNGNMEVEKVQLSPANLEDKEKFDESVTEEAASITNEKMADDTNNTEPTLDGLEKQDTEEMNKIVTAQALSLEEADVECSSEPDPVELEALQSIIDQYQLEIPIEPVSNVTESVLVAPENWKLVIEEVLEQPGGDTSMGAQETRKEDKYGENEVDLVQTAAEDLLLHEENSLKSEPSQKSFKSSHSNKSRTSVHSHKSAKTDRSDESIKSDRSSKSVRSEHSAKSDRSAKSNYSKSNLEKTTPDDNSLQLDESEKSLKSERSASERTEPTVKSQRSDKALAPGQSARSNGSNHSVKSRKSESSEKNPAMEDISKRPVADDDDDPATVQSERSVKSMRSGRSNEGLEADRSARSDRSKESLHSEHSVKSNKSARSIHSQHSAEGQISESEKSRKSKSSAKSSKSNLTTTGPNANIPLPAEENFVMQRASNSETSIKSDHSPNKEAALKLEEIQEILGLPSGQVSPRFTDIYPSSLVATLVENYAEEPEQTLSKTSVTSSKSKKSTSSRKSLSRRSKASHKSTSKHSQGQHVELPVESYVEEMQEDVSQPLSHKSEAASRRSHRSSRRSRRSSTHKKTESAVSLQAETASKASQEVDTEDEVEDIDEIIPTEDDPCAKFELEHAAAVTEALQRSCTPVKEDTYINNEPSDGLYLNQSSQRSSTNLRKSTSRIPIAVPSRQSSRQELEQLAHTGLPTTSNSRLSLGHQSVHEENSQKSDKSRPSHKSSKSKLSITEQSLPKNSDHSLHESSQKSENSLQKSRKSRTSIKSRKSRDSVAEKSEASVAEKSLTSEGYYEMILEASEKLDKLEVSQPDLFQFEEDDDDEFFAITPQLSGRRRTIRPQPHDEAYVGFNHSSASGYRSRDSHKSASSFSKSASQKSENASRKSNQLFDDEMSENIRDKTYTLPTQQRGTPLPDADDNLQLEQGDSQPFSLSGEISENLLEQTNENSVGQKTAERSNRNLNVIFKVEPSTFESPQPDAVHSRKPSATFMTATEHVLADNERLEKYDAKKPSLGDLWMMGGDELDAALERARKMSSSEAVKRNMEDTESRRHKDAQEIEPEVSNQTSTQFKIPNAPNPSVANEIHKDLTVSPPSLHPHSLARIALLKRDNPELVNFARNAVDNVLTMAQETLERLGDFGPTIESGSFEDFKNNHSTAGNAISEKQHRLVISSDKSATANLSASSSAISVDSAIQLPKVPNPSIENHGALNVKGALTPTLNIQSVVSRVVDLTKAKATKDASCASGQKFHLEPRASKLEDKSEWTSVGRNNNDVMGHLAKLPNVPSHHLLESEVQDDEDHDGYDEATSDTASTTSSEKYDTKTEQKIPAPSTSKPATEKDQLLPSTTTIPEPPSWVIDPKVIDDAVTESELTEDGGPSKTSFIQSIFNCFGKKNKPKKSSKTPEPSRTIGTQKSSKARKLSLRRKK